MSTQVDATDPLLKTFVDTFLGYGTFAAPLWFVGPVVTSVGREHEDGRQTLLAWRRRGHHELEDLRDFYLAAGATVWFGESPRLHRIWGKLSRLALTYSNRPYSNSEVRKYQATELGSRSGATCLLYLHPFVQEVDAPDGLRLTATDTRSAKLASKWSANRRNLIRTKIRKHQPEVVVFYDVSHREAWQSIADATFTISELPGCMHATGPHTRYFMLRHPESIGMTNDYFARAGALATLRKKRRTTSGQ